MKNVNQNKNWSKEDDLKLIANRHLGIDILHNAFKRSRRAIRQRLGVLKEQGLLEQSILIQKDLLADLAENQKKYKETLDDATEASRKNLALLEWAVHISKTYSLSDDDFGLLLLAIDPSKDWTCENCDGELT